MLNKLAISQAFMVAVAIFFISPAHAARELGSVRFVTTDATCAKNVSDCWSVEVTCPGIATVTARLKIRNSTIASKGTVIFTEGGSGNTFWGNQGVPAVNALIALTNTGFNTVEVAWTGAWFSDTSANLGGNYDGYPTVACRPATIAKYIRDTFNGEDPALAFCASGNSGGATQVAFMLSHYGLDSILDLAVPTSGPPVSQIETGCYQTPGYESMWYTAGTAATVDQVFRELKNGPCVARDITYQDLYRNSSVSIGGNYLYPKTHVHFVFGAIDTTSAVGQGLFHFDTLFQAGQLMLGQEFIAGAGHQVHRAEAGANAIRDKIIAECRKH